MSYAIYSNKTNAIVTNFLKDEIKTLHSIFGINAEEKVAPTFSMKEFIMSDKLLPAKGAACEIKRDDRVDKMITDVVNHVPELKQINKLRDEIDRTSSYIIRNTTALVDLRARTNPSRVVRLRIDRYERENKRYRDHLSRYEQEYNNLMREPVRRTEKVVIDYWKLIAKACWRDKLKRNDLIHWVKKNLYIHNSQVRMGFCEFLERCMTNLAIDFEAPHGIQSLKFHIVMRGEEFYNTVLRDPDACLYLICGDDNYLACDESLIETFSQGRSDENMLKKLPTVKARRA